MARMARASMKHGELIERNDKRTGVCVGCDVADSTERFDVVRESRATDHSCGE